MKTYIFHVNGMTCNGCASLIESNLSNFSQISKISASLSNNDVKITGEFGNKSPEEIAKSLNELLTSDGYSISVEKQNFYKPKWSDFKTAIPLSVGFIAFFILLQKIGVVNLITSDDVSYNTAFVIGLVASVSTCMAVVGGLTLSISANFAKEGDKTKPQIYFHLGRLISFFILGGVIGALGSVFQLGLMGTFALNVFVALVLLILGINLLDVFPAIKKLQPTIPKFIGKRVHGLKDINHTLTPFLVGIATFFLPCGFTQSMQIYTLTTGGFFSGAMIMFIFALGTLPVLALLSFSSLSIHKKAQSDVFFKTVGLVVIFFGIFSLLGAFTAVGIISPIINI
jgi:sulfite exporter TauE/SafE/copper chaperone CopZ